MSETQAGSATSEHLPFFELLDVVYGRFEAGAVVEQEAGGFQVFVAGDKLVARCGGVGRDGGRLRFPCGERAVGVGPYVGCSQRHGKRMIAWVSSGMIEAGQRRVGTWRSLVAHSAGGRVVAGSNPAVPTACGWTARRHLIERRALDTLYLLMGIIGFFLIIALFFFGGFVLLDFLWGRRGGDL